MTDTRLVGYWSEQPLDPSAVEFAELGFRPDGSGWLYWSSWSTSFTVQRFAWQVTAPGRLELRSHLELSGTWSAEGHEVELEEPSEVVLSLGYTVEADVLTFDRPLEEWLATSRFTQVAAATAADPTLTAAGLRS